MAREFKTLVFCTSYVADEAQWTARYCRWVEHHAALDWGDRVLCMIDDASPFTPDEGEVKVVRFPQRLGRGAMYDYPGWWRSFLSCVEVATQHGCDRIVHVESDAYVLTRRLLEFIKSRESGWTSLWCPRFRFPETGIQVICVDQFDAVKQMRSDGWAQFAGRHAEHVLPFTDVARGPHGNRYSEYRTNIPGYADFAAQVSPAQKVWFR